MGMICLPQCLVFTGGNKGDFLRQAAGLAVLVYLFEKCEVFEK